MTLREIIGNLFIWALVLTFVGGPIILFFQIIRDVTRYFLDDWWNTRLYFVAIDPLVRNILQKDFPFYDTLSEREQRLFVKRTQKFMNMKHFEGREGLFVTVEMEALISATAIQLTFGHPSVYFRNFHTVIIYPDVYFSRHTEQYHEGEVNTRGVIVLSWKNFAIGFKDMADGRNLGLHEIAHALRSADAFGDTRERNFIDRALIAKFVSYARNEMALIDAGEESVFRKYAATNDHEFFAVAVENFFERPYDFERERPEMFFLLKEMLNQDPRGRTQRRASLEVI